MTQKICTFAGHGEIYGENTLKEKLKKEFINLIENENVDTFYCGGKGDFDKLCSERVKELKSNYPFVKSYLILAYMPNKKSEFDLNPYGEYDGSVYPDLENTPPRFAIIKRNEWMIDKSDFLIAYVKNSFGGANKTLSYAKKRRKIKIINMAENSF